MNFFKKIKWKKTVMNASFYHFQTLQYAIFYFDVENDFLAVNE